MVSIGAVVNATMLTSFLIMVKSACIFKISKSRNGDALMEYAEPLRVKNCERFDRSVAVMADVSASVLAKMKNKAKASGIGYQQKFLVSFPVLPSIDDFIVLHPSGRW